jgi:hypothetical protein
LAQYIEPPRLRWSCTGVAQELQHLCVAARRKPISPTATVSQRTCRSPSACRRGKRTPCICSARKRLFKLREGRGHSCHLRSLLRISLRGAFSEQSNSDGADGAGRGRAAPGRARAAPGACHRARPPKKSAHHAGEACAQAAKVRRGSACCLLPHPTCFSSPVHALRWQ